MKVNSVLFVCTGNTCRSPMAEALLRHMLKNEKIEIVSRGTNAWPGQPLSEGARQALVIAGVKVPSRRSKRLERQDVEKADLIFAMTENQRRSIMSEYPEAKSKTRLLAASDIEDPVGGSPSDYEKCRIEIQNALLDVLIKLKPEGSSKS